MKASTRLVDQRDAVTSESTHPPTGFHRTARRRLKAQTQNVRNDVGCGGLSSQKVERNGRLRPTVALPRYLFFLAATAFFLAAGFFLADATWGLGGSLAGSAAASAGAGAAGGAAAR